MQFSKLVILVGGDGADMLWLLAEILNAEVGEVRTGNSGQLGCHWHENAANTGTLRRCIPPVVEGAASSQQGDDSGE